MPDLPHLVLYLVLGGAIGVVGGLFGLGGGLIAIPLLVIVFHHDQQHAQGTSLAMVAPNVIVGVWNYARRGGFDRRVALTMGACAIAFTYVGALFATHVAGPGLRYAFATFIAALALYFTYRSLRDPGGSAAGEPSSARPRLAWGWTSVVGMIGGALSGVFSIGGAIFAVPVLSLLFGYSQFAAQGLSLALVAPGTLVAIATYAHAGDVDWAIGIPLAAGGTVCVRYGVALAHRLPDRQLRLLFCLLLAVTAITLFVR